MGYEIRLRELGVELPAPRRPGGNYEPTVRVGNLLFVAGQLPYEGEDLRYRGQVGRELSAEEGYQAARLCALNALAQIRAALGSLDKVERLVRVLGFINCEEGFEDHARVLNGASDLFTSIFGDRGKHTRLAIGAHSLPRNAAVELEVLVEAKD